MGEVVDCRGLACPQPVIRTRRAMAESDQVTTIVDNETAVANVMRMAEKEGYSAEVEEKEAGIFVHLSRTGPRPRTDVVGLASAQGAEGPLVVLISSDRMGRGDDELGGILMRSFLHTLHEVKPLPDSMIFLNAGVKLTVDDSLVLEDLEELEGRGVEILACGTCLGHFGLKEKIAAGQISNMYSIAEALLGAGKVVGL
jgi:selenium metabolism protein YedF